MKAEQEGKQQAFAEMLTDAGWSLDRLAWRVHDTFRDIDWRNSDVCEIGCGRGDLAIYLALFGAKTVVALDPAGAGSRSKSIAALEHRLTRLQLENLTYTPARFEEYPFHAESFDLLFGINVIEHIHETKLALDQDPTARRDYLAVFHKFHQVLRPGGYLVLTNSSRRSLWATLERFRVPNLMPGGKICWPLHQTPETWQQIGEETGFRSRRHWRVPYPMRRLPGLVDNSVFQYLTWASYIVILQK